jgi:hypothetical protein
MPEPVARNMQAGQPEPERPKRKGVLMAAIAGLVLLVGAGWWAMIEHRARLQAETKAAVELTAAAEAKAQVETMAAAQAKSAAETKAAADTKAAAEAKAAEKAKAVAEAAEKVKAAAEAKSAAKVAAETKAAAEAAQRKQDEERQKLVAERERREAEDRSRREAARVVEEPRKAREEAALEWAESDNGADIDWHEAKAYCASKGRGWRLPTRAELQDSYKNGQSTPCGKWTCKVASKSRLTGPVFWSNEPAPSSQAWAIGLSDGWQYALLLVNRTNAVWDSNERALCVRRP